MTLTIALVSVLTVVMGVVSPDISRTDRRALGLVGFLGLVYVLARLRGWA